MASTSGRYRTTASPRSLSSPYQQGLLPRDRTSALSTPRTRERDEAAAPSVHGYGRYDISSENSPLPMSSSEGAVASSPERRLQAITEAARELKDRILEQSQIVEEATLKEEEDHSLPQRPHVSWRGEQRQEATTQSKGEQARSPRSVPAESANLFDRQELPGVSGLQDHASRSATARREDKAATKIQAVYRAHEVRKSMEWTLPSGGTLKESLQQESRKSKDGVEVEGEDVDSEGTLTPPAPSGRTEPERTIVTTASGGKAEAYSSTEPPVGLSRPKVPVPEVLSQPWTKDGGDTHSVVNIFTRQHQQSYLDESTFPTGRDQDRSNTSVSATPIRSLPCGSSTPHSASLSHLQVKDSNSTSGSGRSSLLNATGSPSIVEKSVSSPALSASVTPQNLSISRSIATSTPATPSLGSSLHSSRDFKSPASRGPISDLRQAEQDGDEGSAVMSPSLVDSYSSSVDIPRLISPLPSVQPNKEEVHKDPVNTAGGRLSPRSLDLKHQAELNQLDVVTSTMGYISAMEKTRAVSLAQQETVNVAQLLKNQHQKEEREAVAKAELEKQAADEQATKQLSESRRAKEEVERLRMVQDMQESLTVRMNQQDRKLATALEGSCNAMADVAVKLTQFTTTTTTAGENPGESSEPKVPSSLVREIAESAAVAAAREAVASALKGMAVPEVPQHSISGQKSHPTPPEASSTLVYEDDFESLVTPTSKAATTTLGTLATASKDSVVVSISMPESSSEVEEDLKEEESSSEGESGSSGESESSSGDEEEDTEVEEELENGDQDDGVGKEEDIMEQSEVKDVEESSRSSKKRTEVRKVADQ